MTPMKPQKNPRVFLSGNSGIFMAIYGYLLIFMDDHVWYLVWSMLRQFVPSISISQLFWASVASPTALTTLNMHRGGHGSFSPPRSHAMAEAQLCCWKPPKNSRAKTAAATRSSGWAPLAWLCIPVHKWFTSCIDSGYSIWKYTYNTGMNLWTPFPSKYRPSTNSGWIT